MLPGGIALEPLSGFCFGNFKKIHFARWIGFALNKFSKRLKFNFPLIVVIVISNLKKLD